MEEKFAEWIADLSIYVNLLPILIGCWRFRSLQPEQRAILALVLLSATTEWISDSMRSVGSGQNLVYYLYTIAEFLLLTYIFRPNLKSISSDFFIKNIVAFFLLIVTLDMLWWSGIDQFNGYSSGVEALLLIFFAISYFYKTLRELQIRDLEREPLFWVSTGVLLYFASSLFIFLFTNYVSASNRTLFIIWGIHGIFNALHYIFYSLALWVTPNR